MSDMVAEFAELFTNADGTPRAHIDILLSQLPDDLRHLVRLCAIPHSFNEQLLSVLDPAISVGEAPQRLAALTGLSIVGPVEGDLCLHETARVPIFRDWLTNGRDEFVQVSSRLHAFFKVGSKGESGAERELCKRRAVFHLIGADPEDGIEYLKALCGSRIAQMRFSDAQALLKLAEEYAPVLSVEHSLTVLFLSGLVRLGMNDREGALGALNAAAAGATGRFRVEVLTALAHLLRERRAFSDAGRSLREASELVRTAEKAEQLRPRILIEEGYLARDQGRYDAALAKLGQAALAAKREGTRQEFAEAENAMGGLLRRRNELPEAIRKYKTSLHCFDPATHLIQRARVLSNLAGAYADMSNWGLGEQCFRESLGIAQQSCDVRGEARTWSGLAQLFARQGRLAEALAAYQRADELFETVGDHEGRGIALSAQARLLRDRNDEEASAVAKRAAESFRNANDEESARDIELEKWNRSASWKSILRLIWIFLLVVAALLLLAWLVGLRDQPR